MRARAESRHQANRNHGQARVRHAAAPVALVWPALFLRVTPFARVWCAVCRVWLRVLVRQRVVARHVCRRQEAVGGQGGGGQGAPRQGNAGCALSLSLSPQPPPLFPGALPLPLPLPLCLHPCHLAAFGCVGASVCPSCLHDVGAGAPWLPWWTDALAGHQEYKESGGGAAASASGGKKMSVDDFEKVPVSVPASVRMRDGVRCRASKRPLASSRPLVNAKLKGALTNMAQAADESSDSSDQGSGDESD